MAKSIGTNVEKIRFYMVTLAALLAASAVSVAGMLGFVGLVVPHMIRMLVGSDFEYLLPLSLIHIFYNRNEQKEIAIPVDGVFVNIGVVPNTDMFKGVLEIDESGHIIAGEDCRTNLPGVFAAGDVRTKLIRQLTTAAADGTIAALLSEKYLESLKEEK